MTKGTCPLHPNGNGTMRLLDSHAENLDQGEVPCPICKAIADGAS